MVRRFVRHPDRPFTAHALRCTRRVPPVRTLGRYDPSFTALPAAKARHGNAVGPAGRRAARAAAETVADVEDRWFNNYSGHGVGLYGGRWSYTGGRAVLFRLHKVRLERDLAISGSVRWERYGKRLRCRLVVQQVTRSGHAARGAPVDGTIRGRWATRRRAAVATLTGTLGGRPLRAAMRAP